MLSIVLPFEKPIVELLDKVADLRALAAEDESLRPELERLEQETARVARELFSQLTPIQKVQLSRHGNRPYSLDYIDRLFSDFVELKGDRRYADDAAIVGGIGSFHGRSVVVVAQQKGRGTKENLHRNFGMPSPEGYRKAIRLYELAGKFGLPIFTLIDTPGAHPGIGAEERGQSEAIGAAIATLCRAPVPVIATIIGEGGSGGALALGVANRVFVLEFGFYSVISPEGCASILWRDSAQADEAASQLKITSSDLLRFKVVDEVIDEPSGGAHQDYDAAAAKVDRVLLSSLGSLETMSADELRSQRYDRFRDLGEFVS